MLKKTFYLEFHCKYTVPFFYNICIKGSGPKSLKIRERKSKERNQDDGIVVYLSCPFVDVGNSELFFRAMYFYINVVHCSWSRLGISVRILKILREPILKEFDVSCLFNVIFLCFFRRFDVIILFQTVVYLQLTKICTITFINLKVVLE